MALGFLLMLAVAAPDPQSDAEQENPRHDISIPTPLASFA